MLYSLTMHYHIDLPYLSNSEKTVRKIWLYELIKDECVSSSFIEK